MPASSVFAKQKTIDSVRPDRCPTTDIFTPRQTAVADALRRGKANKIIAYELNLRESTVKVISAT